MSNSNSNSSIGFPGLLTVAFVVLKLTGHINWSWWWITSSLWIGFLFIVMDIILGLIVGKK